MLKSSLKFWSLYLAVAKRSFIQLGKGLIGLNVVVGFIGFGVFVFISVLTLLAKSHVLEFISNKLNALAWNIINYSRILDRWYYATPYCLSVIIFVIWFSYKFEVQIKEALSTNSAKKIQAEA
jgi:hypothetical protein